MWVKVLKVMKVITVIPMVFDGLVALYKAAKKGIK